MKAFYNLFIVVVLHSVLNCKATSEPICSKFDYEEKLLAKTIRLENTVNDLVKTVTHVQTGLADCQTDRQKTELELKTLKDEVEEQNTTVLELEVRLSELTMEVDDKENKTVSMNLVEVQMNAAL